METSSNRFTKIYLTLWGVCILVGLFAFVLYKFGDRLTNGLEAGEVGSIEFSLNEGGLQIFLNNREQRATFTDAVYIFNKITPGLHSIVVSKDGFWPWTKTVAVSENNVRSLYAFIFPMDGISTKVLSVSTAEYKLASDNIRNTLLPAPKPWSSELLP